MKKYDEIKEKYEYLKVILLKTNSEIPSKIIDEIYAISLKEALYIHGDVENFNTIILKYMKKNVLNYKFQYHSERVEKTEYKQPTANKESNNGKEKHQQQDKKEELKQIKDYTKEVIDKNGRMDLSFLKKLIIDGTKTKVELAIKLKISMELIDKVLDGEYHLKESSLTKLYKEYNVNDVYKLRNIILNPKKELDYEFSDLVEKYLKLNALSQKEFATLIGCNKHIISRIVNSGSVTQNTLQKFYDYFGVKNYYSLIKILDEQTKDYKHLQDYKNKTIELIKEYLDIFQITQEEFAELIGYDLVILIKTLNGRREAPKKLFRCLFNYFQEFSFETLINEIKYEINYKKQIADQIIFLLENYLETNQISQVEFSKQIGSSNSIISDILNKKYKMTLNILEKIKIYFNIKTDEELIEALNKNSKKRINYEKDQSKITKHINEYLRINEISQTEFSKKIGLSQSTVSDILTGKCRITINVLGRFCNYFNVKTDIELIKKLEEKEKNFAKFEKYSEKIVDLLAIYLSLNKITKKEFSNQIGYCRSTIYDVLSKIKRLKYTMAKRICSYFKVTTIEGLIIKLVEEIAETKNCTFKTKIINRDILFQMVDVSTLIDEEYIIFMLLFGEKRCLPSIISELLKINEEYIIGIYNDYLNKYIEYIFQNENNNIKKLEADN